MIIIIFDFRMCQYARSVHYCCFGDVFRQKKIQTIQHRTPYLRDIHWDNCDNCVGEMDIK